MSKHCWHLDGSAATLLNLGNVDYPSICCRCGEVWKMQHLLQQDNSHGPFFKVFKSVFTSRPEDGCTPPTTSGPTP